jgi:hypothetical protein
VHANIYVAALAFLIHRAIEKKLKAARLDLSATEALTAVKSVRIVDIGDDTVGTNRAAWCCAPSASRKSIRQPRHAKVKP